MMLENHGYQALFCFNYFLESSYFVFSRRRLSQSGGHLLLPIAWQQAL